MTRNLLHCEWERQFVLSFESKVADCFPGADSRLWIGSRGKGVHGVPARGGVSCWSCRAATGHAVPHTQQYRAHAPSREAIDMAHDAILREKYKLRHKYGFRPPKTGRKTDLDAEALVCALVCPSATV
jgi:hypothetical protein